MSLAVKIVLHNDENDELELGPFTQGVAIDDNHIIDIATSERIATDYANYWQDTHWADPDPDPMVRPEKGYTKIFIHAIPDNSPIVDPRNAT